MKHKTGTFLCGICDLAFAFEKNLEDHQQSHANDAVTNNEEPSDQPNAGVPKESMAAASKDEAEDSVEKAETLTSDSNLSKKRKTKGRTIKGPMKVFACDECPKSYKRKDHLKRHKLSHTGDRPHVCLVCMKAFARSDKLSRHEEIHYKRTKAKFHCKICSKKFLRKDTLKKHERHHETKIDETKSDEEHTDSRKQEDDQLNDTKDKVKEERSLKKATMQNSMEEQEELLKQEVMVTSMQNSMEEQEELLKQEVMVTS